MAQSGSALQLALKGSQLATQTFQALDLSITNWPLCQQFFERLIDRHGTNYQGAQCSQVLVLVQAAPQLDTSLDFSARERRTAGLKAESARPAWGNLV